MNGKQEHNPRGDVIMEAVEAGLRAIIDVLETHGETTLAEASCISTLLRDILMDATMSQVPTELDMFLCMFADKLKG